MEATDANTVNSIVYLIAGIASPLFGFVIDKTGRNLFWVFISNIVTIVAHMLLTFTMVNPYISMVSILIITFQIYLFLLIQVSCL